MSRADTAVRVISASPEPTTIHGGCSGLRSAARVSTTGIYGQCCCAIWPARRSGAAIRTLALPYVEMALVRADRLTATERAMASTGPGPPPAAPMEVSAELLGHSDDDALRAMQEAEPVDVLVLRDLADEFGTVAAQAGNDVVDVVDSEHDAADAQRVRRRAFRLGSYRRRRVELRQLNPALAVGGPHHGDVGT